MGPISTQTEGLRRNVREDSGVLTSAVRSPRGRIRGESLGGGPRMNRLGVLKGVRGRVLIHRVPPG